jgi:hypothetical protein
MNSKVKVLANEAGSTVIVSENNPEYGHISVCQEKAQFDEKTSFVKIKITYALVAGKVEDLRKLGWTANKELPGKIVIKESLTPFNTKEPERDYKYAGDSGIICTVNDQPIYRKLFYSPSEESKDVFVAHDNGEVIKASYRQALVPNKEEFEA